MEVVFIYLFMLCSISLVNFGAQSFFVFSVNIPVDFFVDILVAMFNISVFVVEVLSTVGLLNQ